MKLTENIEIVDLTLWLKKEKTLVMGDLHLGMEESMQKRGILVPFFQFDEIKSKLEKVFEQVKPKTIIINGDFKHEFGKIHNQEWREGLKMLDFLKENAEEVIITRGNHDPVIGPIAKRKDVPIKEEGIKIGNIYILHGHKVPTNNEFKDAEIVIIGNEHPAIGLTDENVKETYKCFLKGTWEDKTLIVQPSMCQLTIGSDILRENPLSPYMKQDISNFDVFVVEDEVRYFGKVKNLK